MEENWALGRRKSFALDVLSGTKEDTGKEPEKKGLEQDMKKRSQSLTLRAMGSKFNIKEEVGGEGD